MGTLVERTSRMVMLIKLPHPKPASAANVLQAFTDKLLRIAVPKRQSMTYDQGDGQPQGAGQSERDGRVLL